MRKTDSTFAEDGNDEEVAVLASATLAEILQLSSHPQGTVAALGVTTAAIHGLRKPAVDPLTNRAGQFLSDQAIDVRSTDIPEGLVTISKSVAKTLGA